MERAARTEESCRLVEDALDLAAVDVEFAGYGALAVTGVVPGAYRPLHAWCSRQRGWCFVVRDRQGVVHVRGGGGWGAGPGLGSDEGHQELERTGQRQRWPGPAQGTDGPLAKTMPPLAAARSTHPPTPP